MVKSLKVKLGKESAEEPERSWLTSGNLKQKKYLDGMEKPNRHNYAVMDYSGDIQMTMTPNIVWRLVRDREKLERKKSDDNL